METRLKGKTKTHNSYVWENRHKNTAVLTFFGFSLLASASLFLLSVRNGQFVTITFHVRWKPKNKKKTLSVRRFSAIRYLFLKKLSRWLAICFLCHFLDVSFHFKLNFEPFSSKNGWGFSIVNSIFHSICILKYTHP